jgi:N-acetyl-anhydromuramyl-L-alanine amidase AmpD
MTNQDRIYPNVVLRMHVRNWSYRANGAKIELIVIHDTESHNRPGTVDLAAIGNWFDNPASEASCHVCVDGDGSSAIYVDSIHKAWHVAHYNSAAVGIEQIGYSTEGARGWSAREPELLETARWIAHWSHMYRIPIRPGDAQWGGVQRSGVVTHRQLGVLGGNHDDPGPAYPFDYVLNAAARFFYAR